MPTAVEAVERYLETDVALHQALARGLLNIRRAARWVIAHQNLDLTEEAVVSAIRRYRAAPSANIEDGLHLLGSSQVTARTGLALFVVRARSETHRMLPRIAQLIKPQEAFQLFHQHRSLTMITESRHFTIFSELLGDEIIERGFQGVAEARLDFPDILGDRPARSAAIAIATNALAHQGVDLLAYIGSPESYSVFVSDGDVAQTYDLLVSFRGQAPVE